MLTSYEAVCVAVSPVPLKLMVEVDPEVQLVVNVTFPVTATAVVGSNSIWSCAVLPGFRVSGKVTPEMLKPVPVRLAALMVTGSVPEEVKVSVW